MHHLRGLRLTPALVFCIAVLVTAIGGIAYASIPNSSGVINACYQTNTGSLPKGSLRVIDTDQGQSCKPTETALSFNQKGPRGATGPAGPAGGSDGWWSGQVNLEEIPPLGEGQQPLFESNLSDGSYLLNLTAEINGYPVGDTDRVECDINGADLSTNGSYPGAGEVPVLGQLTVSSPEDPQITCYNYSSNGSVDVQFHASAIRVAHLH